MRSAASACSGRLGKQRIGIEHARERGRSRGRARASTAGRSPRARGRRTPGARDRRAARVASSWSRYLRLSRNERSRAAASERARTSPSRQRRIGARTRARLRRLGDLSQGERPGPLKETGMLHGRYRRGGAPQLICGRTRTMPRQAWRGVLHSTRAGRSELGRRAEAEELLLVVGLSWLRPWQSPCGSGRPARPT